MFFYHAVRKHGLSLLFIGLTLLVASALLELHLSLVAQSLIVAHGFLLIGAFFTAVRAYKIQGSVLSFFMVLVLGVAFPQHVEAIEEIYLLIPLLYLMIFPGSLWPIVAAFALLSAYAPSLNEVSFEDFLEDSLELIVISTFATVMAYFQQRSLAQMKRFKTESYTDYLTKLKNRKAVINDLLSIKNRKLHDGFERQFVLMIIDIDNFKKINDQLGHVAGDYLLTSVAKRLQAFQNDNQQFYRLGGDEFAVVLSHSHQSGSLVEQAHSLAIEIQQSLTLPHKVKGVEIDIETSVGMSLFPNDATEIEALYSNADLALYQAKHTGKNRVVVFDGALKAKSQRRYQLENDLLPGLAKQQFFIHYQPKVDVSSGEVVSAEALLRWQHHEFGLVNPAEFIEIAERSGAILDIGLWVLEQVCQQVVSWKSEFKFERVAVNVSAVQLEQSDFVDKVAAILAKTGCPAKWIELEQTESWIMENPQQNIGVLNNLKALGLHLSLDDFGIAYSSLNQLSKLPLDVLKIDKSFIDDCLESHADHMVVRTIIQLAQNLDMTVIAEGVETEDQRLLLQSEGCQLYQGFLYSKPVAASQFERLLIEQKKAG